MKCSIWSAFSSKAHLYFIKFNTIIFIYIMQFGFLNSEQLRRMKPSIRRALLQIIFIWLLKDRSFDNNIPRSFICVTTVRSELLIV
jgi:hypothetical protein